MTATRQGRRLRMASALVPLALLSAAWTVSIGATGAPQATAGNAKLPDGTAVPSAPLQVPASVTDDAATGATGESSYEMVSTANASSIPAAALAAYQRAETVINRADASCHLPWQLLAAIGRVESNHGRAGLNVLGADGIAAPGIYGPQLNGAAGTSVINDTDAGRYDGDAQFDRAVGPMQFIPSTWSSVGVDADGDGQRNPQDVNDAALAAAVYLCSGDDDLSQTDGQRAAVFRYNHSDSYVSTVLAVLNAYLSGDFLAAPNATIPATYFQPDYTSVTPAKQAKVKQKKSKHTTKAVPTTTTTTTPETQTTTSSGSDGDSGKDKSKDDPATPTSTATATSTPVPSIDLPTTGAEPVDQVLTYAEAKTQCLADLGVSALPNPLNLDLTKLLDANGLTQKLETCITGYTTP
ncbi:lytic transglycosylase domain-containing protein [Nocardioides sp.]|uniref:lytic transglycosylase domain-containing protein n=1 Tax=Nocardioides sp. TaxID=35761 RepID=UPI0039E633D7